MKKYITIVLLLVSVAAMAQNKPYVLEATDTLKAGKIFQLKSHLFGTTTQVNGNDTSLVTLQYFNNNNTGSSSTANLHVETGRIESLTSRAVTVNFINEFINRPIGEEPQVYRVQNYKGNYRREKLLWGWATNSQPTTTGFSLNIDASESLTGVVLEYIYVEVPKDWILENGTWDDSGQWADDNVWIDS